MADQPTSAGDVKSLVEDRDIRFIRLWFTDILGQLKSFSINAQELDDAFEGGMGFDGSSITGFNAIEESDMIAMPDASTFKVLVPDLSDRLLSERLKELEAEGIVQRRVIDATPVHVEYALTEKGTALEPAVRSLKSWARSWL